MILELLALALATEQDRATQRLIDAAERWILFVLAWLQLATMFAGIGYHIAQGNTTGCAMMFNFTLLLFAINIENLQHPHRHENSTI